MFQKLFPTYVYQAELKGQGAAGLNRDLLEECYKIRDIDAAGIRWSQKNYQGGYTSYGSMDQLHRFSSTFEDLKKRIDAHVLMFAREAEMDIGKNALRMQSCWANIMSENARHTMHLHPLSVISGTYYLKTPRGAPGIKFEDPRLSAFMGSPPRKAKAGIPNQRFVTLQPSEGYLVLFESWLKHEVPTHLGQDDRVSVSFNYDWVR